MAGVHDLFVENEVLIEDGEGVILSWETVTEGLLRQRVALVKQPPRSSGWKTTVSKGETGV